MNFFAVFAMADAEDSPCAYGVSALANHIPRASPKKADVSGMGTNRLLIMFFPCLDVRTQVIFGETHQVSESAFGDQGSTPWRKG